MQISIELSLYPLAHTQYKSEKVSAQAIMGKASMTDVVQAVNDAEMTLQTVIAVRDKIIDAYQRIMQMAKSTQGTNKKNSINDLSSPPIREAATAASRQSGVSISRIQPEADNKVTFWIDKAGTQAIMNWLVLLKTQYGYNPSKVTIQKNTGEESLRGQFEFEGDIS